jgi:hypothetical protein
MDFMVFHVDLDGVFSVAAIYPWWVDDYSNLNGILTI